MKTAVIVQVLIAIALFAALAARAGRAAGPSPEGHADWEEARAILAEKLIGPLRAQSATRPRHELFSRAAPRLEYVQGQIDRYELIALGDDLRGTLTVWDRTGRPAACAFRIDLASADVLITDGGAERPAAEWLQSLPYALPRTPTM